MRRNLMLLGTALIALCAAGRAHAGAWLAPKEGQQIWASGVGVRDETRVYETSGYVEAPVDGDHSVVLAPWLEQAADLEHGWRAEATLGLKRVLLREGPNVLALQGGAYWRSDPPAACRNGGGELRVLAGRALGEDAFLNVEVAGRGLIGDCTGLRVELTAGWRPNDDWLTLGQLFYDDQRDGGESLKLQFSIARFDRDGGAVQLGVRTRLDGDADETALVLAFWGRPGD